MSAADGYHATEYHVDGTDVVVPESVTLETAADYDDWFDDPVHNAIYDELAFDCGFDDDPIEQVRARFADVPDDELERETAKVVGGVTREMQRENIFRAAGRIALARLTRKDLSNRCPICRRGDLDQCPEPTREGHSTRQQRRASARESAKAPRAYVWYRCEACRATMRILSRKR